MAKALLLAIALFACICGMGWFALAKKTHWQQVRGGTAAGRRTVVVLRALGTVALFDALVLCLVADHASMAVLVWVMALATAALIVAFTLSWRPRLLAPLVAWVRDSRSKLC